jgi:hypothetical protein
MKFISATDSVGLHNHWWNNFSRAVWNETNGDFLTTRAEMLQEYGAKLISGGIEFETDEQATWFLLRWS